MIRPFAPTLVRLLLVSLLPLSACGEDKAEEGPGLPAGLAVVNSDYKTVSVSLIDPAPGSLARDNCLNSGSTAPMLSQALSGDVVLPSAPQPGHELVLVDRGNGTLTWVDPATCGVNRQMSVSKGFSGMSSNPYDIAGVSASKAYVPRYNANPAPSADPDDFDEGNDVLVIDPSTGTATGRIDVAAQKTADEVVARPSRALYASGQVFVTLGNISADFMSAGPGRVLVIDPASDTVASTIDLPGLKGCQGLTATADGHVVYVVCGGSFADADQAAASGVAVIDSSASPPALSNTVPASSFGGRALAGGYVGALGPNLYAVTSGDFMGMPPDQLWAAGGGAGGKVADAKGGFVFGGLVVDQSRSRLFLADADAASPRVHVYDLTQPLAPARSASIEVNPAVGLPPRDLGWY